jgi:hypothetical protein
MFSSLTPCYTYKHPSTSNFYPNPSCLPPSISFRNLIFFLSIHFYCKVDSHKCGSFFLRKGRFPSKREFNIKAVHRKKKVRKFPVPSWDVTTKLSLGGNNDVITELFLPRGSLVSDIPGGDGKLMNLFLRCRFVSKL